MWSVTLTVHGETSPRMSKSMLPIVSRSPTVSLAIATNRSSLTVDWQGVAEGNHTSKEAVFTMARTQTTKIHHVTLEKCCPTQNAREYFALRVTILKEKAMLFPLAASLWDQLYTKNNFSGL